MGDEHSSKWFEVGIAALGVAVTAILGYGQWQLGQGQAELSKGQAASEDRRAQDAIEVQVMSMVSSYFAAMREPGKKGDDAQRVVLAAAEYLSNDHKRPSLAAMAAKISQENPTASLNVQGRFQEASIVPDQAAPWYAVLASLSPDDLDTARSVALAKQSLAAKLGLGDQIHIYRTKISNNIAIVIGGALTRERALELAARSRETKLWFIRIMSTSAYAGGRAEA